VLKSNSGNSADMVLISEPVSQGLSAFSVEVVSWKGSMANYKRRNSTRTMAGIGEKEILTVNVFHERQELM
jgi:hypothetical protein